MLNSSFGIQRIGQRSPAEILAAELPEPLTDGTLLQLLLRQEYESYFGLFDHNDRHLESLRPLAAVAMHDREQVGPHTSLHKAQLKYVQFKIRELTGLSFTEFHMQPPDMVQTWYDIAFNEQQKAAAPDASKDKMVREMERTLAGGSK